MTQLSQHHRTTAIKKGGDASQRGKLGLRCAAQPRSASSSTRITHPSAAGKVLLGDSAEMRSGKIHEGQVLPSPSAAALRGPGGWSGDGACGREQCGSRLPARRASEPVANRGLRGCACRCNALLVTVAPWPDSPNRSARRWLPVGRHEVTHPASPSSSEVGRLRLWSLLQTKGQRWFSWRFRVGEPVEAHPFVQWEDRGN